MSKNVAKALNIPSNAACAQMVLNNSNDICIFTNCTIDRQRVAGHVSCTKLLVCILMILHFGELLRCKLLY